MRDFKGTKVLVLNGASRQVLGVLEDLHSLGCHVTTLNHSKLNNGYASRYPDKKLLCAPNGDQYRQILDLVSTGEYDVVLPLADVSMDPCTAHCEELSRYARLPVPPREVFMRAFDKQNTMCICMDNGIPCPLTKRDGEDLDAFIGKVGFPFIIKPRVANGSKGLKIIRDREQLDKLLADPDFHPEQQVIQEFIPQTGTQYNVHCFFDADSTPSTVLVTEKNRWFPVSGGASCMCRTAQNEQVRADSERLLKAAGWVSYCEIEFIIDPRDGIGKVMEINGRASASIKIMHLAGINVARQMLELAFGEKVSTFPAPRDDIRMRCLMTDILWLLKAPDRFTRKPCWFSPVRTHDVIFSLKDPLPAFAFILFSIPRYKREMKKRQRD